MVSRSRSSVYVNSRIDFLLAVNVQSEIIGKNNWIVFGVQHGDFLQVETNIEIHNNGQR